MAALILSCTPSITSVGELVLRNMSVVPLRLTLRSEQRFSGLPYLNALYRVRRLMTSQIKSIIIPVFPREKYSKRTSRCCHINGFER